MSTVVVWCVLLPVNLSVPLLPLPSPLLTYVSPLSVPLAAPALGCILPQPGPQGEHARGDDSVPSLLILTLY
jgi:hypothetical protein